MQMYRVVPKRKEGNSSEESS